MKTAVDVVALSGGKDSTAMALRLQEVEPGRTRHFVLTPTGNELPDMVAHWAWLRKVLDGAFVPLATETLAACIDRNAMIPNFRARFCTKELKIYPFAAYLARLADTFDVVTSCVGIRADESEREAGDYTSIPGVVDRYPLREWGWTLADVKAYLEAQGVRIPRRTDCALCFFQRLGEWWDLWRDHPDEFDRGVEIEERMGHTFRSPKRDKHPTALKDLRTKFEAGYVPKGADVQRDLFGDLKCRVCRL